MPISEEIAFRGVIQTALTDRFSAGVGIGVTAVVFVGKHLLVDSVLIPTRVVALVILAVVLGLLRARYGTGSSVVAHVVANAVGTAFVVASLV
ncbi:MAG: type II CAAX prenyl endopeptidase Rce1 family protein [Halobaculum sp.]